MLTKLAEMVQSAEGVNVNGFVVVAMEGVVPAATVHALNAYPAFGVAVNVTGLPEATVAAPVTLPFPSLAVCTLYCTVKFATNVRALVTVNVYEAFVETTTPFSVQLVKALLPVAVATNVVEAPEAKLPVPEVKVPPEVAEAAIARLALYSYAPTSAIEL